MSRTGKIARLPKSIREELNHRLEQNTPGRQLADWLNSLPEVQGVLSEHFDSKPIREQNLSEWRQGGFLEWQTHHAILHHAESVTETSEDLEKTCGLMADHAAQLLAARIAITIFQWKGDPDDPSLATLKPLYLLARIVALLRRGDHQRLRLQHEHARHDSSSSH